MGGISEVDGMEEVDILAVCLNRYRGWGYKNDCFPGTIGLINTKFGHSIPEGVPYHQVASFLLKYVTGCAQVHKMHPRCFSGLKMPKTRKDTTWSGPNVFLSGA